MRLLVPAVVLVLVVLAVRGWVRLGQVEAALHAADHELANRD